eukprot:6168659-Amphidinium_carterae.1
MSHDTVDTVTQVCACLQVVSRRIHRRHCRRWCSTGNALPSFRSDQSRVIAYNAVKRCVRSYAATGPSGCVRQLCRRALSSPAHKNILETHYDRQVRRMTIGPCAFRHVAGSWTYTLNKR